MAGEQEDAVLLCRKSGDRCSKFFHGGDDVT